MDFLIDFSEALKLLKQGHPVARKGWKGEKQMLILAGNYSVLKDQLREKGPITKKFVESEGLKGMYIHPHIDIWSRGKDGMGSYVSGWVPTQSDMFAEDWYKVETANGISE